MFRHLSYKKLFVDKPLSSVLMMDGPKFAEEINKHTEHLSQLIYKNHINHLDNVTPISIAPGTDFSSLKPPSSPALNPLSLAGPCSLCQVSAHHLSRSKPCLALVITEHLDDETNFMANALREKYEINAKEADFDLKPIILPHETTQEQLQEVVSQLNANPDVHAISIQRPLPDHLDPLAAVSQVCVVKDVDGLHHLNVGLLHSRGCNTVHYPCAALAVKKILERLGVNLDEQRVAVVGTSNVAGRPVAEYLLKFGATVTSFGRHAPEEMVLETIAESDVVVTACGQPNRFRGKDFKEGSIVIDFGLCPVELSFEELHTAENEGKQFKLCGDVMLQECVEVCSHVVAPENGTMSVMAAVLLENTMRAYELCIQGEVGNDVLKSSSFLWQYPGPPP